MLLRRIAFAVLLSRSLIFLTVVDRLIKIINLCGRSSGHIEVLELYYIKMSTVLWRVSVLVLNKFMLNLRNLKMAEIKSEVDMELINSVGRWFLFNLIKPSEKFKILSCSS